MGLPISSDSVSAESDRGNILFIELQAGLGSNVASRFKRIGDRIAALEVDPVRRASLARARQQVARDFYSTDQGSPVARARLLRGWSQKHLADAIGSSQPHVARIEAGRENLLLKTVAKLADALGVDRQVLASQLMPPNP